MQIPDREDLIEWILLHIDTSLFKCGDPDVRVQVDNSGHVTLYADTDTAAECMEMELAFRKCMGTFGSAKGSSLNSRAERVSDTEKIITGSNQSFYYHVEAEFTIRSDKTL